VHKRKTKNENKHYFLFF